MFIQKISLKSLIKRAENEIKADEDLILQSIFASILATFGIYLQNQFILIGAMLIAPFIDPVVSIAVFLYGGKFRKVRDAFVSLFIVTAVSLVCSSLLWTVLSLQVEVLQIPDMIYFSVEYFYVAVILGAVGMFLWTWPKRSTTSAGISVGISLIPPLTEFARSIIFQNMENITISGFSFLGNFIGIVLGAILVLVFRFKLLRDRT